jgi:P-type conjugative transfer protein TrbL
MGANASGTGVTNPSGVMDIGFDIFNKVMSQTSIWSPTDSLIGALLAGVTLIVIALIAANMTIMLCSAWILLYAGIFFLGFGGSRWTSEIALHYYRTLLGVAVSLMAMILMVGIAQNIINGYYNSLSPGINIPEIATIMVVAVILLLLVNRMPGLISGILTGASINHSGIGSFGAAYGVGAALGVAAVAKAAAGTAGTVASMGAQHIGGSGQALKTAFQSAQQTMAAQPNAASGNASSSGLSSAMGTGASVLVMPPVKPSPAGSLAKLAAMNRQAQCLTLSVRRMKFRHLLIRNRERWRLSCDSFSCHAYPLCLLPHVRPMPAILARRFYAWRVKCWAKVAAVHVTTQLPTTLILSAPSVESLILAALLLPG